MTDREPIDPARALSITRAAATISSAALLGLAALSEMLTDVPRFEGLALPAGLIGLVSPAIGRHLYELIRQSGSGAPAFVRANFGALAVTGAVALFGIVAFVLSGRIVALTGVLMHVILTGALWPTEERFENFIDGGA